MIRCSRKPQKPGRTAKRSVPRLMAGLVVLIMAALGLPSDLLAQSRTVTCVVEHVGAGGGNNHNVDLRGKSFQVTFDRMLRTAEARSSLVSGGPLGRHPASFNLRKRGEYQIEWQTLSRVGAAGTSAHVINHSLRLRVPLQTFILQVVIGGDAQFSAEGRCRDTK